MPLLVTISNRFTQSLRSDNLASYTRRVSILSVTLGCIALIVSISILTGYEEAILNSATRFAAHIEVRPLPGSGGVIANADHYVSNLSNIEGVKSAQILVQRETLVRTKRGLDGGILVGLSQDKFDEIKPLIPYGHLPHGNHVVIGATLATNIGAHVGDTILLLTASEASAASGKPILAPVVVDGIVRTGMYSYDASVVAMNYKNAAQLIQSMPGHASAIGITLQDTKNTQVMLERLSREIPNTMYLQSFLQKFAAMSAWIELQKRPIPVVLGLISLVAVFTVVSTLLIAVVQKTKSVAILLTLGMSRRHVMRIFLHNGMKIGVIGSIYGIAIAFAFAYIQNTWAPISLNGTVYYVTALPVSYDWQPYVVVPVVSIILCVIASLVPVWIASKISPASALRFA